MLVERADATVDRAKLEIKLPLPTMRNYIAICFSFGSLGWVDPNCAAIADDREWILPAVGANWNGQAADTWVRSPPGSRLEYGTFPPARVRAVAFGAVPVEATAHITQTVSNGVVVPLKYEWLTSSLDLPAGTVIPGYEDLGPSPGSPNGSFAFPVSIRGPVRIQLSDVVVDGVAVDVGDSCQTPATTLELLQRAGWYNDDGIFDQDPDPSEPGAWTGIAQTSDPGLPLIGGTVDVPRFRGCGRAGENLDPLITAMVSGPGNRVVVGQRQGATLPWCADGPVTGAPSCPAEPGARAMLQPSADLRAARRALVDAPLSRLPEEVRDQLTPSQRRDFKRFVRENPDLAPLPDSD